MLARLATFLARCRLGLRARRSSVRTVPLAVEGLEERTALAAATAAPGSAWVSRGPSRWSARLEAVSSPRRPSILIQIELPPADPFHLPDLPPTNARLEPTVADDDPGAVPSQAVTVESRWTVPTPPVSSVQRDSWAGLGEWNERPPEKFGSGEAALSSTESPDNPAAPASDSSPEAKTEPVVSPTVSPAPGFAVVQADGSVFRINRTPADRNPLRVHYEVTAYAGGDAVSHGGEAVIAPGSAHVEVAADVSMARPAGPEIITLTLKDGGYQVARPTATLFRVPPGEGCSEAALFEAYRRGQSDEAFGALVERHRDAVFRTCSGILGNRADAEDVSQIVFMKLGRMQAPLQSTLTSWLTTVARNASIEFLRSRNRRMKYELRSAGVGVTIADEALYELREELDAALAQLPDALREAVRLRYLEGLSQQEAAAAMGCPRGTLSQRAARGIQCLRTILLGGGVVG